MGLHRTIRIRTLTLLVVVCSCTGSRRLTASDRVLQFEGGSIFAPGYRIKEDQNTDTPVATGVIEKPQKVGLRIQYAIFTPGFVFAEPRERKITGQRVIWSRRVRCPTGIRLTTLVEETDSSQFLYVSLPGSGPANFVTPVRRDKALELQVDEIERIVSTFRPNPKRLR
jgi:hypothetical protein